MTTIRVRSGGGGADRGRGTTGRRLAEPVNGQDGAVQPRLPSLLDHPVAFGRLGAASPQGQSGIERLSAIVDRGAPGTSADVWLTADGVPVLDQTGRVGGRFRRRALSDLPATAMDGSIPTLADLYRTLGPERPLSLDVRDPAAFEPVVTAARSAGAEDQLWLCHQDVPTLTSWRPTTSARLINVAGYHAIDGGLERRAAELEQRNIDGIRLDHKDWTGGRVTLLHRFARLALGAGVVFDRETAALIDAGADGVYSERIEPMVAIMAEFYGSP